MLSMRVVTSLVVLRAALQEAGARSCSRQASSTINRMRRSPSASAKRSGGGVDRLESRPFAGQQLDEVRNDRQEIFGLLAKLGP